MNRYALSVSRCLIAAFATACLATGALAQQGPPGGLNVNVLNTPLPVQLNGSASVTGSVKVTNTPLPVQIVNPPNVPPSTVTVANPVSPTDIAKALGIGTPFQAEVQCAPDNGSGCAGTFAVPSNQRIVLEYASAECLIDRNTQVLSHARVNTVATGVFGVDHRIPTTDHVGVLDGASTNSVTVGQTVRLYASPGTFITVSAQVGFSGSANPSPNFPRCTFDLSGQSVPVP
jgi:hypothetical protein